MNKTKSLTKTFIVAIFAFAMMFAGVSFVVPQKTTVVYAAVEGTNYTVTIGSNNKPSWSNGVVPTEMKSGDSITITFDGCDEYNDGQIFVDSVSEKQISGYTGTISYTATKDYTVSTHGSKGDMLYYVYLTTKVSGYTITYDANGATSGTVPTDTTSYAEGASVTVLDNTGSLTKDGYIFSGWNTKDDGTGTDYAVGASFTMPALNTTLYADWVKVINAQPNYFNGYSVVVNTALTGTITYQWYKQASGETAEAISGATLNSFPASMILEDVNYYCEVSIDGTKVATSNSVLPIKVVFNGNTADSGTAPSTQYILYKDGYEAVILPVNPFTKAGYKFVGWSSKSSATSGSTSKYYYVGYGDDTDGTLTLYAIWESLAYNKEITLTLTTLEYGLKASNISVSVNDSNLKVVGFKLWYNGEIVDTITQPGVYTFYVIIEGKSNTYYFVNTHDSSSSVIFPDYYSNNVNVSGNTVSVSLGSPLPLSWGVKSCDLTSEINFFGDMSNKAYENVVLGNRFSFDLSGYSVTYDDNVDGDSVSNMPEDTNTYLEDAPVTVSTTTPTRTGYKFIGWNTDKTAKTALTFEEGKYKMGSSNATLYAIWQEKDELTVSYTVLDNTHTYDKTGHGLDGKLVFGQSDILITDIKYASHIDGTHADSDWSTTAPINAGTYDIKIYRAEDATYAEYNEVTKSAIVINQKEVGLSWDNCYQNYTGSEIKPTCTLTGVCVGDECTVEVTGGKINIGLEYVATATNLSNSNYKLPTKNTTNFNINIPLTITRTEYNKSQHEVIVNTSDEIKNTFTFEYKLTTEDNSKYTTTKPINAGLYTVKISRAASAEHNEYISEQPNMLEIYKKPLTYSWTNTRFIYDGNPHLPTVTITNLESGDVCNLTVTGTQTDYSELNYYATIESCDNSNYDITENNKHTFNIYPETLYYNIKTGKLVYINEAETEFVATEFNGYYSVSDDHKTLTLKNINHVLNYNAGAFTIDTRVFVTKSEVMTEHITIVLEGTNNLGCSTSGGYGVTFLGDVTIKGDGILNISGQFFLNDATEITSNLLTVESGTINVEIINDTEKEGRVSFLAENTLNVYGGKITVNNPLKINTLFGFRNGNFLLYASQDKNTQLSLINKVDYDTEEGRYISEYTVDANTTKYYYAEIKPLIITQEPSANNNATIKTNVDGTYQWYVISDGTVDLEATDINEYFANEYSTEYSYNEATGWSFSAEGEEAVMLFVVFNDPQYTTVTFTSNEELSLDFVNNETYEEYNYNLLFFIKKEEGVYYYKAGLVFEEGFGYFVCCLDDEDDLTIEINNVCFITDIMKVDGATSSSYATPTETGAYYVVAKASFATVKSQSLTATEITYDVNGGNGSVDSIIKFEGTIITLDDGSSLSKNNCGFVGWNTDKNATTAISNTYTFTDSDVTLYAIWADKQTPTVTAPTAKTLTYTGSLIDLINAGTTTGGTIQYSLGTISASGSYSSNLPQGKDVGIYYVWYKVVGNTYYFDVAEACITVTINKLAVNEPTVAGTYKYTGNAQTVTLNGVESYMTTTDSLTQTDVGIYTIHFTLDNNHEWATGSDGIITWEIKSIQLVPEGQQENNTVIVETEDGFSSNITVVVEVTVETEIEQKELSVDYYNLEDEAKLSKHEKVGIVFNVKLIQTIGDVSKEIQPSDIKAGTKIKVKMLIPETVDISKVTRILHVHLAGDIEEIEFDASKVDENGYYEIEIDRLSEFAFIYQTDNQSNTLMICVLGGLGLLLIALLLVLFLTKRKVIVIANEKFVKEFKFRPLQTIEFKGEINDLDLFADRELTNAFTQQKMGFKSIVVYGKDVKPKVTKTTTKKATTSKTTATKKVSKTTKNNKIKKD